MEPPDMMEAIIALIALTLMEIVLGIDNIVFISILTAKLPVSQQSAGRRLGLLLALVTRLILLSCIFWIAQLTTPVINLSNWLPVDLLRGLFTESAEVFTEGHGAHAPRDEQATATDGAEEEAKPELEFDQEAWDEFIGVSWRDLILLAGGLFLIYNSVREIHHEVEGRLGDPLAPVKQIKFSSVLFQIAIMDVVFSLDSVITAVGMAKQLWVMITAVVLAVAVMILFANQVGNFVDRHPTVRMLALNFLLLIGVMLVAEGAGTPINKGYIYFAMAFSMLVETLNIRIRHAEK
jgi:predicted tellurium resistance membrane protein TerC